MREELSQRLGLSEARVQVSKEGYRKERKREREKKQFLTISGGKIT